MWPECRASFNAAETQNSLSTCSLPKHLKSFSSLSHRSHVISAGPPGWMRLHLCSFLPFVWGAMSWWQKDAAARSDSHGFKISPFPLSYDATSPPKRHHGVIDVQYLGSASEEIDHRPPASLPSCVCVDGAPGRSVLYTLRLWPVGEAAREKRERRGGRLCGNAAHCKYCFIFGKETWLMFNVRATKLVSHCSISRLSLRRRWPRGTITQHRCNFWAKIRVASSCSWGCYGSIERHLLGEKIPPIPPF